MIDWVKIFVKKTRRFVLRLETIDTDGAQAATSVGSQVVDC